MTDKGWKGGKTIQQILDEKNEKISRLKNELAILKTQSIEECSNCVRLKAELDSRNKQLEGIENKLDQINVEVGEPDKYCLYCDAHNYDGKVGVIHDKDCPLQMLRELIKAKLKEAEKSEKVGKRTSGGRE